MVQMLRSVHLCRQINSLHYRYKLHGTLFIRNLSIGPDGEMVNVYKGLFAKNLQFLKRFSVFSSVACTCGLPILLYTSTANIVMAGKIAIAGTAFVTSVSSTLLIQYCTMPYIISLEELKTDPMTTDRSFVATRLTMFGSPLITQFKLSEVERITSTIHPFATFRVRNNMFFVFGSNIADPALRSALTSSPIKS